MMTSPPRPPSPPEGPPRGTNFSRRKATHPLPPSPAFTRIFASSINIKTSDYIQCSPLNLSVAAGITFEAANPDQSPSMSDNQSRSAENLDGLPPEPNP